VATYWSTANGTFEDLHDHFDLADSRLLGISTANTGTKYSITRELQSSLEASGIDWPALMYLFRCMAHIIQPASGAVMSSPGVKGCNESWEAHQCDHQFGENESVHIWKSQRLQRETNARINKVSAMKPGLAKIIGKVRISRYFQSAETDQYMENNACCIEYSNTWSFK